MSMNSAENRMKPKSCEVKNLSVINRSSHIICKEKEKDTYPFYYCYTEVWKDWFMRK